MPKKINVTRKKCKDRFEQKFQEGFGKRVAYILFGIPRNCIEGIFVGRELENNKEKLDFVKSLFPECYICNIDGKVIK